MKIDFHTHAFEDGLAERALAKLSGNSGLVPALDGTVGALRASMEKAGISRAVVCPIATRPHHFAGIRDWARRLRAEAPELEMLLSIHPDDPDAAAHLEETAAEGFKGVKFHPYYQGFAVDERRMYRVYEKIRELGLLAVFHCGFDIAYPRDRTCDPWRIRRVVDDLPGLRLVATHFGGWDDWDEAERWIVGQPIWLEVSMTAAFTKRERVKRMAMAHPAGRLLFGTDSPWTDESEQVSFWEGLGMPEEWLEGFFGGNAARLLAEAGKQGKSMLARGGGVA